MSQAVKLGSNFCVRPYFVFGFNFASLRLSHSVCISAWISVATIAENVYAFTLAIVSLYLFMMVLHINGI